jgi:hypothetical protein
MMKRIGSLLGMTTVPVLASALPALAGYAPPPPAPGGSHGGAGTAFTGSEVSIGIVLLAALVVVGLAALLIGRRRPAARR